MILPLSETVRILYHSVFIAVDDPEAAGDLLWKSLHEGRPVILVKETEEQMLIAPIQAKAFKRMTDRLRGRVSVAVGTRPHPIAASSSAPSLRADIRRNSLVSGDLAFACA
jgi:hypothetical protein